MLNPEGIARDVIVIGASAGGVAAIIELLCLLPRDIPAVLGVVIHRGSQPGDWSSVLGMKAEVTVLQPSDGDPLRRGCVYVAPPDCHMRFERDTIGLDSGAKEHRTRPAVDPLFTSAARSFGPRVVGVVLTGGGHDGMKGLVAITHGGGISLVQEPSEAENASMPEHAIAHDHVGAALSIHALGAAITRLARGNVVEIASLERERPHLTSCR